jgi:tRNA dimethylallyltransferase
VADFKSLAEQAAADINGRGKLPIMVGGTGLYVDSVLYNYQFGTKDTTDRQKIRPNSLVIGLKVDREELKLRIEKRADAMLVAGLEHEVQDLARQYGWDCLALKNVSYAQWRGYFDGENDLAGTRRLIIKATVDLAKRQRTWFKRNNSIQWFATPVDLAKIVDTVTTFLST